MRNSIYFLLLFPITIVLSTSVYADDAYSILNLGKFHGDEVSAKNGEKWFGLFVNGSEAELKSGEVIVERVYDEIVDDGLNKKTGKQVKFKLGDKIFSVGEGGLPIVC